MAAMIRIGVVGTGLMASERARSFGDIDGVSVVGVCSRNVGRAKALCNSLGATAYDDYTAMLRDCDAVVICAPNDVHSRLAGEALAAGMHVLVEYPLCTGIEDAAALGVAAEKSGSVLMVGNTIIHEAPFRYLVESKARLGRILSASSRAAYYGSDIAGSWYMDRSRLGPAFSALHYHHIEYYRHLLGRIEWVLARDQRTHDKGSPDCASLVGGVLAMGHDGGAVSSVQWYLSSVGDGGLPRGLWITGSESSVTIVSQEDGRSEVIWDGGGEGKTESIADDWGVSGSCRDFIDAVEGRLDHRSRLISDILTMRVGILATESACSGGVVPMEAA